MRNLPEVETKKKTHKGTINNWKEVHVGDWYCIMGTPVSHPYFVNWMRTSRVLERNGNEIETMNSFYTLGEKATDD